jgi:hypothetical protein
MSKKLFVGSLSWDTNDEGLRSAFGTHGEISEAIVISDRDSGRSRGFGFVTFDDDESADKAVAALNGTELQGRCGAERDGARRPHHQGGRGPGQAALQWRRRRSRRLVSLPHQQQNPSLVEGFFLAKIVGVRQAGSFTGKQRCH